MDAPKHLTSRTAFRNVLPKRYSLSFQNGFWNLSPIAPDAKSNALENGIDPVISSFISRRYDQFTAGYKQGVNPGQTYIVGYFTHEAGSELQEDILEVHSIWRPSRYIQSILCVYDEYREDFFHECLQLSVAEEA